MKCILTLITVLGMECRALEGDLCKLEGFQQANYTKGPAYAQVKLLLWGHKGVLQIKVIGLGKIVFKSESLCCLTLTNKYIFGSMSLKQK